MHINFKRDLSLINVAKIYINEMEERPYLQQATGPIPAVTDCVLGANYCDVIGERLLRIIVNGHRCFGLTIGDFIGERIGNHVFNRDRLFRSDPLSMPTKITPNPTPIERHYDLSVS